MIDVFDLGFDDKVPAQPAARTYEPLPEGEHDVEIVAASVGTVQWKASDANPEGQCLRLRLSGGRDFGFLFADLAREKSWLFKALAAALGVQPDASGKVSIGPPEQLVGRTVRVEIGHYKTRGGETRANVKRWLPAPGSATKQDRKVAAPRRPAATKATPPRAAEFDPDDIPF